MASDVQYKEALIIKSGGYPGEPTGSTGVITNWTDCPTTGTNTATYYYTDSNSASNANSSKVYVTVKDSWQILSISDKNVATIKINTSVTKIERKDIVGNPNIGGRVGRFIKVYNVATGAEVWSTNDSDIAVAKVLLNREVGIGSQTVQIQPSTEFGRSTAGVFNASTGHEHDPVPSIYIDEMTMGVTYRNTLLPDYRPGASWDGSTWQSHNRTNGKADIYTGSNWITMRTVNGAVGTDNPPYIYNGTKNVNQRKIGDNA